jgi:quinol monooxygenase YgiN
MNAASASLVPAIKKLPGCIDYYVATEESSLSMVNVSVWQTIEHANGMSTLKEMADLAQEFISLGVVFERPIVNYPVLWNIG